MSLDPQLHQSLLDSSQDNSPANSALHPNLQITIPSNSYIPPQPRQIEPTRLLVRSIPSPTHQSASSPINIRSPNSGSTRRTNPIGWSVGNSVAPALLRPPQNNPGLASSVSHSAHPEAHSVHQVLTVGSVPIYHPHPHSYQPHLHSGLANSPRPIYLSSTPPPTTFAELRQAQRSASSLVTSPSNLHPQLRLTPQHQANGTNGGVMNGEHHNDPSTPRPIGLPPTVALTSIESGIVPSPKDELRLIYKLGYPVALAILFRIAMAVTDLAMLGHKDTDYLAASASALIWINITSAFLYRAFGSALNTLCSQAYGAGNFKLVGYWLQQGVIFSTLASFLVGLSWWWTEDALLLFSIDADIAALGGTFARWSLLWLLPQVWMEMLNRFYQAQQIIWPALCINAIFVLVNAFLNLLLIYGIPSGWIPHTINSNLHDNGWDGLGFIGSPIATSISRWLMFISYFIYTCLYRKYHAKTFLGWALNKKEAFHPARIKQFLLHQCLPASIGVCLEEWQLEIVAIFATKLGSDEIATHNATLEIFFFLTSLMFGLVTAVQVRIGQYLGAGNALAARQVARIGLKVAVGIGVVIGAILVGLRDNIGRVYSSDPEIWHLSSQISILVGASYALLAIFYTAMAVLNGQGRPFIVAVSFLIGCWCVCLPMSYVFAFTLHQGLIGLWYGLCLGYAVVTLIVGWHSYRSDWVACATEARQRSEMKKAKEAADPIAQEEAEKKHRQERRARREKKKAKRQQRAASKTKRPSLTGASILQGKQRTHSLNDASPSSNHPSTSNGDTISSHHLDDHHDDESAASGYESTSSTGSSVSVSSEDSEWNSSEIDFREAQLQQQRLDAVSATTTALLDNNADLSHPTRILPSQVVPADELTQRTQPPPTIDDSIA